MPSTEEFAVASDASNLQRRNLMSEVHRLQAENAALRAAGRSSQKEQMSLQLGQAVQLFIAAGASGASSRQNHSLIDVKGLGKPPVFKNQMAMMASFTGWLKNTSGFLVPAYGAEFRAVLEWIEDQE